jgi:hypothetical protein
VSETQSQPLSAEDADTLLNKFIPANEPKVREAVTALVTGQPLTKAMVDAAMREVNTERTKAQQK